MAMQTLTVDNVALNLIQPLSFGDCTGPWKLWGDELQGRKGLFISANILPAGSFHRFRVMKDTNPIRAYINFDFEGPHPGAGACIAPPNYPERPVNQGNVGRIFVYAGSSDKPPGPACGFPPIYRPMRGCQTAYGWLIEVDSGSTGSYDMTILFFEGAVPPNGWSREEDLQGILTSAPAVASWGPNRLDCFYRGQNNHLWHRYWDGSRWSGEEDLGGVLTNSPAVSSWAANRLDCFYRGQNNHMWHRYWDGSRWSGEEDLGGVLVTNPAAVSWGNNRIDCFYVGQNNQMWHRWYQR
jgi:hypothetical protein